MEERDIDFAIAEQTNPRPTTTVLGPLRAPRQSRSTTPDDRRQLERSYKRIAELERQGVRVREIYGESDQLDASGVAKRVVVRRVLVGEPDLQRQFIVAHQQLRMAEERLGPERTPSGVVSQFHRHGVGYSIAPFQAWMVELMSAQNCDLQARGRLLSLRDRTIWFLWNYRNKAEIVVGPLTSKVRWHTAECTGCGLRFSLIERTTKLLKAGKAPHGCPKCGCPSHRDLTPQLKGKVWRTITKAGLQWRFKASERKLESILSAELVPRAPTVFSSASSTNNSALGPDL